MQQKTKMALIACGLLGCVGCSNGGTAALGPAEDASLLDTVPVASEDAGTPAVEAGPLWQPCQPANPASCPAGFECFPAHTSPVDAFDTCVLSCAEGGGALCAASAGTCACPLSVTGGPGDCSEGNDAGSVTVCVPFGDGGPSGNNELEDAGAPPDDAGAPDAGPG